jgi:sporulation protein YlmC with PRC-barrel domain
MSKFMTTTAAAALLAAVAVTPAIAQETQPQQPGAQQQTQQQAQPAGQQINYVQRQNENEWAANTLIGMNVENHQGENLGSINNVIVNEQGDVVAVTIGVGGFLGIGEKDVGVPYEAIEFRLDTDRTAATRTGATGTADRTAQQPADGQTAQQQAARPVNGETAQRTGDRTTMWGADQRDNVVLMLNATREQLEAAPEYVWLTDQDRTG